MVSIWLFALVGLGTCLKDIEAQDVEELTTVDGLIALPPLFGYSASRGSTLFPSYVYPRCEFRLLSNEDKISIDYRTNKLSLSCSNPESPFVIVGPKRHAKLGTPQQSREFLKRSLWRNKPKVVKEYVEFAIGSCRRKRGELTLNFLQPRFNATAYAEKRSQFDEVNHLQKKPMLLLFLTPDSFSRNHMFRKLNATIDYLNELRRGSEYAVFDLRLHNIIGSDTSENQMRIFGKEWVVSFPGNQSIDYFGTDALWHHLSKLGFMTLYGTDGCASNTPLSIGLLPQVDHVVNLFFCAHTLYGVYSEEKRYRSRQRCIGQHMAHHYLMEYSLQFARQYSETNLWVYNHYTAGHEATGQHAQTLDPDLSAYLETWIKEFGDTHEIVMILGADHGMRYGNFQRDIEAIQEHRLPGMFIVARHELLKSLPGSFEALTTNSLRLTTKPDLRETMLGLPKMYFGLPAPVEDKHYYNLFADEVPLARTCKDAQIPAWYCSTYVPQQVPAVLFTGEYSLTAENQLFVDSVNLHLDEILYQINTEALLSYHRFGGLVCKKLSFDHIEELSLTQTPDNMAVIRAIFTINEDPDVLFDAWFALSDTPLNGTLMKKILTISRLDSYAGPCEVYARQMEVNPKLCLCRDDLELKEE